MTEEPYRDPIEEEEKAGKNPETAPPAPDDWPRATPDRAPADPDDEA